MKNFRRYHFLLSCLPTLFFAGTVTNGNDSGSGSLRNVITNANNGDTINFDSAVTQVDLITDIPKAGITGVTIQGPTNGIDILQTGNSNNHFALSAAADFTFNDLLLKNAIGVTNSGGIDVNGASATMNDGLIDGSTTTSDNIGAGINAAGASVVTVNNSTVSNCSVSFSNNPRGGGIRIATSSTGALTNSVIDTCSVSGNGAQGGGLFADGTGTPVTLTNSTITNCSASSSSTTEARGGGMMVQGLRNATLLNTTVSNCKTSADILFSSAEGGGVLVRGSSMETLTDSIVINCSAFALNGFSRGGGLFVGTQGTLELIGTTVTDCNAFSALDAAGGGIYTRVNSTATLTDATITNCVASSSLGTAQGGGIFVDQTSTLNINGSITMSGNEATEGKDIYLQSGGNIHFDLSQDSVIPNPIEGGSATLGQFTKTGTGKLTLNGDNRYSAPTMVNGGELEINGSTMSDVTVATGATFSGNCAVKAGNGGSGDLTNSGVVRPGGDGVGTITVEGMYNQSASGTLEIDITPTGQRDLVALSANGANLAGDLKLILGNGSYIKGTTYEIITGPSTGTFNDPPIKVGPEADDIDISITYGSVTLTINNTQLFTGQNIPSGNQQNVVDAIEASEDTIDPNSTFAQLLEAMGQLNNQQLSKVLNHMSPAPFGVYEWINLTNNSMVARLLAQHTNDLCCSKRNCIKKVNRTNLWVNGFGNFMNEEQYKNLRGFRSNSGGVLAGVDRCFSEFLLGASLGYIHSNMRWDCNGGRGNVNSFLAALYGSFRKKYGSLEASVFGGLNDYNTTRRIQVAMVDAKAKSDPQAGFFTTHLGGSLYFYAGQFLAEILGTIDYHFMKTERFKESDNNSGIALDVRSRTSNMMQTSLGARFSTQQKGRDGNCVKPYAGLFWVRKIALNRGIYSANFVGQNAKFSALSFSGFRDYISPEAGIKITTPTGLSISIGYRGEYSGHTNTNQADARLEYVF